MENKELEKISKKLDVLISLYLRSLLGDKDFERRSKLRTSVFVNYLANFDLETKDIAGILGAPVQSVRTLLTPKRRRK